MPPFKIGRVAFMVATWVTGGHQSCLGGGEHQRAVCDSGRSLAGIAIGRGAKSGPARRSIRSFPEYASFAILDPCK
jgi:hypothetical protein